MQAPPADAVKLEAKEEPFDGDEQAKEIANTIQALRDEGCDAEADDMVEDLQRIAALGPVKEEPNDDAPDEAEAFSRAA